MGPKNEFNFFSSYQTNSTNFQTETITSIQQLVEFCNRVKFPSHAIILKIGSDPSAQIYKEIQSWEKAFGVWKASDGLLYAETDMRAHLNPTRMAHIALGFSKFLKTLQNECPHCSFPGLSEKKVELGLPCAWCNSSTSSVLHSIHLCEFCHYEEKKNNPFGKSKEDPMFCNNCNP